jgi:hypothetical protein
MHLFLVTANIVPLSPILVTLITEALHSFQKSVLTIIIRPNIPEDGIQDQHIPIISPKGINNIGINLK